MLPQKQAVRSFSTSFAALERGLLSRLGSWVRREKPEIRDPTTAPQESFDETGELGRVRKLRVLGEPQDLALQEYQSMENYQPFKAWPTSYHRASLTAAQIEQAVSSHFTAESSTDLQQRFVALKAITQELQVAFPDHKLPLLDSPEAVKQHLLSISFAFHEKQPDALRLEELDFGANVETVDVPKLRRTEKSRFRKLQKQAEDAERALAEETLAKI